jgi:hypothetical protein
VRPVFDRLFREHGLPDAIRTDNGVPSWRVPKRRRRRADIPWLRIQLLLISLE